MSIQLNYYKHYYLATSSLNIDLEFPSGTTITHNLDLESKPLLVIAHPGHELQVLGWANLTKPNIIIATDGSGRQGEGRFETSKKLLEKIGCNVVNSKPFFSDSDLYELILNRNDESVNRLMEITDIIIAEISKSSIDYVVADRSEGYNSGHDIIRYITNLAVSCSYTQAEAFQKSFDFTLIKPTAKDYLPIQDDRSIVVKLNQADYNTKLDIARSYTDVSDLVSQALELFGNEANATEVLRPVVEELQFGVLTRPEQRIYEHFGQQRLEAGLSSTVISYEEHIQPLVVALYTKYLNNFDNK
jgi:hypothetical protein